MARNLKQYEDVLEPRRSDCSHFIWSSKKVDTVVAYKQKVRPTPDSHKLAVLEDPKIQEFLEVLSEEKRIPKNFLETQVRLILDEIGYNKNLRVIRWLGLVLVKICLKVCKGIYINKDSILHTKSSMGSCPVIFVPSHRSYADFILMSFVCFTYDVEIPAIAAGMDFHGMWAMGSILRDTGAFFMRRSYNDDSLYWTTFKQYIYQLVTKGDLPIEFFIEGTRSRSNKSLMPKYGLLNMILKPLYLRQVPDILFVPINISYEKILEEKLFSFELLGVPKPKESTSAFLKSLGVIKEKYGSIHMSFGQAISSKQFFGEHLDRSRHSFGPVFKQELSEHDKTMIPSLAHEIVCCQQKLAILNIINLIALLVNHNITNYKELLNLEQLKEKVVWLKVILETLGAVVWSTDVNDDINEALLVHKNIVYLNDNGKIDVVRNQISLINLNVEKLKAYRLSEDVMTYSVPFVMLYIYINPVLHYFVDMAIILAALKIYPRMKTDILLDHFSYLRNILLYEFVTYAPKIPMEFENALSRCKNLNLIKVSDDGNCELLHNPDLQDMLISSIQPFLYSYFIVVQILETYDTCDEKEILTEVQKKMVVEMEQKFIHPYSLNLDSISNCLSTLTLSKALKRNRGSSGFSYEVNRRSIQTIRDRLEPFTLKLYEGKMIQNTNLRHKL